MSHPHVPSFYWFVIVFESQSAASYIYQPNERLETEATIYHIGTIFLKSSID